MGRKKRGVSRRDFLGIAAAMGVGVSVAAPFYRLRAWSSLQEVEEFLKPLVSVERKRGPVYENEHLEHLAFPLGGIGTGSVALMGTGEIGEWQIWNRIHKPARVGQTFFALSCETGGKVENRVLQTVPADGAEEIPPMAALRFRGEYPIAFVDFEDDLPVKVTLEATSPMVPLEPENSAFPLAVFIWKIRNDTDGPVRGHLLGSLQNGVGHDGLSAVAGYRFSGYGGNRSTVIRGSENAPGIHLSMDTSPGEPATFSETVRVATNSPKVEQALRYTRSLHLHFGKNDASRWISLSEAMLREKTDVIWLDRIDPDLVSEPYKLMELAKAVEKGTHLVISDPDNELVRLLLDLPVRVDETVLIADFEGDDYGTGWKVEGESFGDKPATGTFPGQNPVSGYVGLRLVNTFNPDDVPKGKLISPEFTIGKRYLHFLVGGGKHEGTEIRLLIDGKVIRRSSGLNSEELKRKTWDLRDHVGRKAHLEIVDDESGGWGHILVDDIRMSDQETLSLTPEEASYVSRLLPFKANPGPWRKTASDIPPSGDEFFESVPPECFRGLRRAVIEGLKPKNGSRRIGGGDSGAPVAILGRFGKGMVLFLNARPADVPPTHIDLLVGGTVAFLTGRTFHRRTGWPEDAPVFGSMALGCLTPEGEALPAWTDAQALNAFLEGRPVRAGNQVEQPTPIGESFAGAIRVPFFLEPGQEKEIPFWFSWYFPNHYLHGRYEPEFRLGNEYNNRFSDALDVSLRFASRFEELLGLTRLFTDSFYRSTLPVEILDCVSSQFSIIRTQTSMWLEDGTFAGWEGCSTASGCCPMNCTHVYNYAQAMACLYPQIEREIRAKDLGIQLTEEGLIHHRLRLPLTAPRGSGEALDGQLGTLLKLYREYRRSPDETFLRKWWEPAKKALRFVFERHDPEGEGVIRDRQFNTYDHSLYDLNSFIGTLYLAALRAMEELAGRLDEQDLVRECRNRFQKGSRILSEQTWNGEFFYQLGDPDETEGRNYGKGCLSDQVVGQWWSHLLGLGYLLPEEKVKSALRHILRYNWRDKMAGVEQAPRVYAGPEDSGLLNCTWPNGGRPRSPILYCDEVWTGIEYQVAGHLMFEGETDRAHHIVKNVRRRSDGRLRKGTHPSGVGNPWNEIECGDHYARAMSSYSLLLAAQGQTYEGPRHEIGFHPRWTPEQHVSFFTAAEGWGTFEQVRKGNTQWDSIRILRGRLPVRRLSFSLPEGVSRLTTVVLRVDEREWKADWRIEKETVFIETEETVVVNAGARLILALTWSA